MYSLTIEQEMSMAPPVATTPDSTTPEPNVPNGGHTVECSTSPSLISSKIKQEKRDDRAKIEKSSTNPPQTANTPIAFSITNILSNSFGNTKLPTNDKQTTFNNNKMIREKKNSVLFRPYDDDSGDNETSPKKPKLDRRQRSDDEESNGELHGAFLYVFFVRYTKSDAFVFSADILIKYLSHFQYL